jgi:hypothetical protein
MPGGIDLDMFNSYHMRSRINCRTCSVKSRSDAMQVEIFQT